MSRRIIGHIDGKPVWSDNDGGARGRLTGSGDGLAQRGYALTGGSLVQAEPSVPSLSDDMDKAERERVRARRYYERNRAAVLERQRAAWAERKGAA